MSRRCWPCAGCEKARGPLAKDVIIGACRNSTAGVGQCRRTPAWRLLVAPNRGTDVIQAELIGAIAAKLGGSKADAGEALEAVLDNRQDALVKGETIKLPSFGQFEVAERTGRNPQTGAETTIAASKAPKFSAGKALKDAINGNVA